MAHRQRTLTALVVVFAMAFTQGCHGPSWSRERSVAPQQRVYLSRAGLLTLHHRGQDGVALQCTARQALGTVLRVTADSIVLRDVTVISGPTIGTCSIVGEAFVVMADVPGLVVKRRVFSIGRTTGLVVAVTSIVGFIMLIQIISSDKHS